MAPDGRFAYVVTGGGSIRLIRTATNQQCALIRTDVTGPIVITPDGRTAYAVSEPGDAVIPINLVTRKAGPPIPVGTFPYSLALTPDGKTLYAAGQAGKVYPISTATNTAGTPIPIEGGAGVTSMDVTPDGRTLYVAGDLGVTPITVATGTPRPFIETGQVPFSMVITPDSRKVYLGMFGQFRQGVTPVSTARGAAGPLIPAGRDVVAMALTPGARTLWAAAQLSDTVTPIRTATDKAGAPVRVDGPPGAIIVVRHRA